MKNLFILILLFPSTLFAQKWVDTTYQIKIDKDSVFGQVVDFAGNTRTLKMDIAYPTNDTPPSCGRPLMVVLYGGAWMTGDKSANEVQRLMTEFAKRGYVAIAPNYRLGLFQTNAQRNCNISTLFNVEWNCLNIQDTAEWYRAYYRAVQDAKGAIRYMINHQSDFNLNPKNIFTCGFSAGGFTALGAAFLDHESEWLSFADSIDKALSPNSIYDNGCVKKYGWDTSISSMSLERPSLGSYNGSLNYPAKSSFRIRGAGSFYGAMFYNLFDSSNGKPSPAVYAFHQPNDLIVPYKKNRRVFDGYSACVYSLCNAGIINRPRVHGSPILRDWATSSTSNPIDFYFDSTKNNTDCAGQIANPSLGGHQLDNWTRTFNMANFFAPKIDTTDCASSIGVIEQDIAQASLYPNPAGVEIVIKTNAPIYTIHIYNTFGKLEYETSLPGKQKFVISNHNLKSNVYLCSIYTSKGVIFKRLIIN